VDEWAHARHDFDAAGLNRVTHAADGEEAQNELCGVLSDRLHARPALAEVRNLYMWEATTVPWALLSTLVYRPGLTQRRALQQEGTTALVL
jgi:hypothetical protein